MGSRICARPTWLAPVVLAFAAFAADPAYATWSELASDDATPEQKAFLAELDKIDWVQGPTTVTLVGNADLQVPEGFVFLDAKNASRYLELNQNIPDGSEVMIAPDDLSWTAYMSFLDEGYVKDNEEIDADALLSQLKEGTEAANAERRKRGWEEMHIVGWATPPNYNRETKRLEWATRYESGGQQGVNFFTKILGRRGHMSVQMVSDPEALMADETTLNNVLTGFAYNSGDTYAEFKSGDKVAEYGLAAMVVGGAAAVAAKKGLFPAIAAFFAAGWKLIAGVAVAAIAGLRSLFRKKQV